MAEEALEAGARAVLTFLEAAFPSDDVTRLPAPPNARLPGDAVYFRIADESGAIGSVGATPDFLQSDSTTALVERLHREDLPGAIRRAGAGRCVMLTVGGPPIAV